MNYKISASLICAEQSDLASSVKILENKKVEMLHIDVMDGMFVPRYGMYPEQIESIRNLFTGTINVHMMVNNPEPFIERLKKSGADMITIHPEPNQHLSRTVKIIKDSGLKVGVCLNISTPVSVLEYIKSDLDLVMLMAINPGILGQDCWAGIYKKIENLRSFIGEEIMIEIDGGVKSETAPLMVKSGANVLTCGTGTIFRPHEGTLDIMIDRFRTHMQSYEL